MVIKQKLQLMKFDEAGNLPADLKRGVLSEDGIWNLLADNRELMNRMREVIATDEKAVK